MKPAMTFTRCGFFTIIRTVHDISSPLRIGTALGTTHDVPVLHVFQIFTAGSVVEIWTWYPVPVRLPFHFATVLTLEAVMGL